MSTIEEIRNKLAGLEKKAKDTSTNATKITEACFEINKSWSGSSFVGHAKYFFHDFQEPATLQRFSIEWGLIHGVKDGWVEMSDEKVMAKIESDSGATLDEVKNVSMELENGFLDVQREAVLELSKLGATDLDIEKIEKYNLKNATDIFNNIFPTKFMTRDTESASGYYVAPHIYYDAVARSVTSFPNELKGFMFELDKITRKIESNGTQSGHSREANFVESSTILKLSEIRSDKYDLTKLIKLCKELNDNYSLENYLACGMIIRTILDHIPPIFGKTTFKDVIAGYGSKSFKDIMQPLDETARKISDSYLHTLISKKEMLPSKAQVSFQPNMDVLLVEIVKVLSV